jgi:hypothetical protein
MILVPFHGGDGADQPGTTNINNVYGFDETTIDPTTHHCTILRPV